MNTTKTEFPIRVAVVEDNKVLRTILKERIAQEPKLQLTAEFDRVHPTLAWLEENSADVMLIDLSLPDGSGVEVIRRCAQRHPMCEVLVLSVSADEDAVFLAIKAGASGYLVKEPTFPNVVRAIFHVREGGTPMSPLLSRKLIVHLRKMDFAPARPDTSARHHSDLTRREIEILRCMAQGYSYDKMAKSMNISVFTVHTHAKKLRQKLSVQSRAEAVAEGHKRGIIFFGEIASEY